MNGVTESSPNASKCGTLLRVALIAWGALSGTVPCAADAASSGPKPRSMNVVVGPTQVSPQASTQVSTPSTPSSQSVRILPHGLAATRPSTASPVFTPSAPTAASVRPSGRILEIIPQASYATAGVRPATSRSPAPALGGADPQASTDPCVNVFVRATKVDGREVLSADLHGDGLIKAAVPPHLGGELLARAGSVTGVGGARAACVPPSLAQRLLDPVVNVAAVDPAVRMARVGDRWVLAGSRAAEPVAKAQPVQLAAATTRGAAKKPAKKSTRAPKKPRPVQVAYNIYP